MNDGERPLALYVFSNDETVADDVLRRTTSGGACVNAARCTVRCRRWRSAGSGRADQAATTASRASASSQPARRLRPRRGRHDRGLRPALRRRRPGRGRRRVCAGRVAPRPDSSREHDDVPPANRESRSSGAAPARGVVDPRSRPLARAPGRGRAPSAARARVPRRRPEPVAHGAMAARRRLGHDASGVASERRLHGTDGRGAGGAAGGGGRGDRPARPHRRAESRRNARARSRGSPSGADPDAVDTRVSGARQHATSLPTSILVRVLATLGTAGIPGLFSRRCLDGQCCETSREQLTHPVPGAVRYIALYSRDDAVVSWEACLDPDAELVEVGGTHSGMGMNAAVWSRIAALRP